MTFRSALLASAAILSAGSAFAADLPARVAPAPYIAAPIFTWTGFYVGLNAGAAWNNSGGNGFGFGGTPAFILPAPTIYGGSSDNSTGFTGGVTAGYNWQMGSSFVLGVEGDLNYIDRSNGGSVFVPATAGTTVGTYYTVNRGDANNFYGTLRARLGFAFDRALIYATGGLAFGGGTGDAGVSQTVVTSNAPTVPTVFTSTTTRFVGSNGNGSNVGWALGGGVEYAFSNAWSVKLEYLHVDLGSKDHTFFVPATTNFITVKDNNKFDVVRAGVNFRF